jgi:hypothetical protein
MLMRRSESKLRSNIKQQLEPGRSAFDSRRVERNVLVPLRVQKSRGHIQPPMQCGPRILRDKVAGALR